MPQELSVYDRVTDPIVYAEKMGSAMSKSGMFGLPNDQAGMVVAMTCLCEKMTPIEFLRTYHIVQGRPSMRADAMLAEFRNRGGDHEILQRDENGASVKLTDWKQKTQTFSFTWEEAQREDFVKAKEEKGGGIKDNYAYPRKRMQMLWARVISDGVRAVAPEIVAGIYTPEEMEDFEPAVAAPVQRPSIEQASQSVVAATATLSQQTEGSTTSGSLCSDIQVARLNQLFSQLEFPAEKIESALAKRGVRDIGSLTPADADQMIEKLQGMLAAKN